MITIKVLNDKALIEKACALLYEIYIKQIQWKFSSDNPSQLRVETHHLFQKVLVDRFFNKAIWFGAFDESKFVGCIRLCGADENGKFEMEGYPSSKLTWGYLPRNKHSCIEMTKLAVLPEYTGKGVSRELFLAAFQFCEKNQLSVFTCSHNGYLKSFYNSIEFPLILEQAFKYEFDDEMPVNFYFADYKKDDIKIIIGNLKYLERSTKIRKHDVLALLQVIAPLLPAPVYWHDRNGTVLGINEHCLHAIGTTRDIIGKTPYDFYPKEIAEHILKHNEKVMRTEQTMSQEERIEDITTKKVKYFSAVKSPLYDNEGHVIGIVGTSIDITAEKEAEALKVEKKAQDALFEAQEEFRTSVGQMVHDIRTPLSTLQMTVQSTREIPEEKRIALRDATMTITDITGQLLRQYEPENKTEGTISERQIVLVSTILSSIAGDNRRKYKDKPIKFEYEMTQLNAFLFIKVEPSDLKRSISNLINNAVEALPKAGGVIELKLTATDEWVTIKIFDDGAGIPKDVLDKINNKEAVTHGKKKGHGLGLTVVRDMVKANYGEFEIASSTEKRGHGTTIMLRFPRVVAPNWMVEEISLTKNDIVIILDDDTSIHGGWDSRLDHILEKVPTITIKHFSQCGDVIDFVNSISEEERQNICFLSDYELIGQELNGLQVIEKVKAKRSMLVTSYYSDVELRKTALQRKVKVLPKDLVHVVPIRVVQAKKKGELVNVHMVFVDDEKAFTKTLVSNYYSHLLTESYSNPLEFLDEVDKYPKDTKIVLDNYYYMEDGGTYKIDGVTLAQQLHAKGYTKLLMLSGEDFMVPEYLTLILKTDRNGLSKLDQI